ncbi:hypothetical protein TFLX_04424 [Thermoflexales bacterium]|nr:hypothetical protein TFLX_04424 [Thermoflexales bacterium]
MAKARHRVGQRAQVRVLINLMVQLVFLSGQSIKFHLQFSATAFVFGQRNNRAQISFRPTLLLRGQTLPCSAEGLSPRLQVLRQPMFAMGAHQGKRKYLRMHQDFTQILPDQFIELPGRNKAGRAFLVATGLDGVGFAPTDRVAIFGGARSPDTSQLAYATAHQAPQQIIMRGIVASGELLILRQLPMSPAGGGGGPVRGLDRVELFLSHDRRDRRHEQPLLAWQHHMTPGFTPHGLQGRPSPPRGHRSRPTGIDLTRIGWIHQNIAQRRLIPAGFAARRRHLQLLQVLGQAQQTTAFLGVPSIHLAYPDRLGLFNMDPVRVARMFRINPVAKRHMRPGQPLTGAKFALAAQAHPFGNQGALIFGDGPANLQQQLIMGILTHGPIQKFHEATGRLKFVQQQHLMHIVARQPIRRRQQDLHDFAPADGFPQTIQPGPVQLGPAVPVIAKNVRLV